MSAPGKRARPLADTSTIIFLSVLFNPLPHSHRAMPIRSIPKLNGRLFAFFIVCTSVCLLFVGCTPSNPTPAGSPEIARLAPTQTLEADPVAVGPDDSDEDGLIGADDYGNVIADAFPMLLNDVIAASMDQVGDVDVFSIDVEEGELYEIWMSTEHDRRIKLRLLDGDGVLIAETYERTMFQPTMHGRYFIEVADLSTRYERFGYTLEARLNRLPDDHGYDLSTSTELDIGVQVHGTFRWVEDADYFRFRAEEGQSYDIRVTGGNARANFQILDSTDDVLIDTKPGSPEIGWVAPVGGVYYIRAIAEFRKIGNYAVEIEYGDYEDDHSDAISMATEIQVGQKVYGSVDRYGDVDYFRLSGEAGRSYRVSSTGPVVVKVLDADRNSLGNVGSYEFNWSFVDTTSDSNVYMSVVGAGVNSEGAYDLIVEAYDQTDDHGNTLRSATPISVGELTTGAIEFEPDVDFFTFNAEIDTTYRLLLDEGSLRRGALFLLDSEGTRLEPPKLPDAPIDRFVWTARSSEPYFVVVTPDYGYGEEYRNGDYSARVEEYIDDHADNPDDATAIRLNETVVGSLFSHMDVDSFKFAAEPNTIYQIDVALKRAPLTFPGFDVDYFAASDPAMRLQVDDGELPINWRASRLDELHIAISTKWHSVGYEMTITELPDDHGDDPSLATEVTTGKLIEGVKEYSDDVDVFAFDVIEGQAYELTFDLVEIFEAVVSLTSSNDGSVLYRSYGRDQLRFVWQAENTERVFVEVLGGGFWRDGPYTFQIDAVDDKPEDEHSGSLKTSTVIEIGSKISGTIWGRTDRDVFRFIAEQGKGYTILIDDDVLNNFVVQVLDGSGNVLAARTNVHQASYCFPPPESYVNRIVWEAPRTNDYFIAVAANPYDHEWYGKKWSGNYSILIDDEGTTDDYSDSMRHAHWISPGDSVSGMIGWARDVDVFGFVGEGDQTYTIKVKLASGASSEFDVIDGTMHKLYPTPLNLVHSSPEVENNNQLGCNTDEPFAGDYRDSAIFETHYPSEYFITVKGPEIESPTSYTLTIENTR